MAKILVIGASQGTGALCVKSALAKGHAVTAFARSPDKLTVEGATRVKGDFHDAASVAASVAGHDAVIVTASASSLRAFKERPTFFSEGTAHVIAAMKQHGVARLVVLSALGTGDSRALMPWIMRKLVIDGILKYPFTDHMRQEQLVRDSGLAYVIARPGRLTNGPARGRYVATPALEHVPSSISRADLADFLVTSCTANDFVGRAVHLGG